MNQRDISATIDDIYGFKLSAEQISKITDYVLEEQQSWQNLTFAPFYTFLFEMRLRDERMRRLLKCRGLQKVGFICTLTLANPR